MHGAVDARCPTAAPADCRQPEAEPECGGGDRPPDRAASLAGLALDGCTLRHASPQLRSDREAVLVAVSQSGWALEHAALPLRADAELVQAACAQNGLALQFAADALKAHRDTVPTCTPGQGRG